LKENLKLKIIKTFFGIEILLVDMLEVIRMHYIKCETITLKKLFRQSNGQIIDQNENSNQGSLRTFRSFLRNLLYLKFNVVQKNKHFLSQKHTK
jgi:hypothetical protein